jgi:hypothetical protein
MVEMRERAMHPARLKKKKTTSRTGKQTVVTQPRASKRVVKMGKTITVADLAAELQVKSAELVGKLMNLGMMVAQNQSIDFDTAVLLAADGHLRGLQRGGAPRRGRTGGGRGRGKLEAPPAGRHGHGSRRPRQDFLARRDP